MNYNTIKQSGATLAASSRGAVSQGSRILKVFQRHPLSHFAPHEILEKFKAEGWDKVSVRRAITDLTTDKKLVKNKDERDMIDGGRGRKVHTWRLKLERDSKPRQGELF